MNKVNLALAALTILGATVLAAQEMGPQTNSPLQMNHAAAGDMSGMHGDGSMEAMGSMQSQHMDMGPHMKMTSLREPEPGDQQRADQVVQAARKVAEKYTDYRTALADGFRIFMPSVPQKVYHFTNYSYAFEASQRFNPEHPSSLLYEKNGDSYKLIGVMYTAPKNATESQLDSRIPLSIAQWHAHVNLCLAPPDKREAVPTAHPRFGVIGSISTQEDCAAAGGEFVPQVFGWMVHVYPFERKSEDIWSVERQKQAD